MPRLEEAQSLSTQAPLGTLAALSAHNLPLELLQAVNSVEHQTRGAPYRQAGPEAGLPSWISGLSYDVWKLKTFNQFLRRRRDRRELLVVVQSRSSQALDHVSLRYRKEFPVQASYQPSSREQHLRIANERPKRLLGERHEYLRSSGLRDRHVFDQR